VLTAVTLYVLGGTDFFGDFTGDTYALFYNMNWEYHTWDTWCRYADQFSHMVMMFYSGETTFNQPELLRHVYIDEKAFISFFYQCYGAKYGDAIVKEYGSDVIITPTILRTHTEQFLKRTVRKPDETDAKWKMRHTKALKKRIPPLAILTRYVRLCVANDIYWVNDYRPNGSTMFNPLELHKGLPYYGFIRDPTDPRGERLSLSPICSPAKPIPSYCVPHTGKHRKKEVVNRILETEKAQVRDIQREGEKKMRLKKHRNRQRELETRPQSSAPVVIPARYVQKRK
jgi:hypothetical protein